MHAREADRAVALVVDHHEIGQLLQRYARGVDRLDFAMVRACYHPDARDEHGVVNGSVDDFIDWLEENLPAFSATTHFLGTPLIVVDGDVAHAETRVVAYHRIPAGNGAPERDFTIGGRYLDRFERRDGGPWLIAHRTLVYDWERTDPVDDRFAFPLPDSCVRGRRDDHDLSEELPGFRRPKVAQR